MLQIMSAVIILTKVAHVTTMTTPILYIALLTIDISISIFCLIICLIPNTFHEVTTIVIRPQYCTTHDTSKNLFKVAAQLTWLTRLYK